MTGKSSNWFARHKILSIVLGLVLIVIIAAAANSSSNTPTVTTKSTAATSSSKTNAGTTSTSKAATAHVGATVNVGGNKGLGVTLQQVIDPATGADEFTTPDAGKRFVAVKLQIVNNGSASYNDDANNNVTLIGSDNQSYTADFEDVSECTNFSDGEYTLAAGESATGCVVFQVPDSVNTAKIQFQTISGFSDSTGEWLVP